MGFLYYLRTLTGLPVVSHLEVNRRAVVSKCLPLLTKHLANMRDKLGFQCCNVYCVYGCGDVCMGAVMCVWVR